MIRIRKLLLLFLLLFSGLFAGAQQPYSYIYLQGDKTTPFYVKLEGEMLPRYGKNYFIIPRLVPGILDIEILFQQNAYPPQRFAIKVPENGFRGFLITRQGDEFSLLDLQQQFYLPAGNDDDADRLPPVGGQPAAPETGLPRISHQEPARDRDAQLPATAKKPKPASILKPKPVVKKPKTKPAARPASPARPSDEPRFMEHLELSNEPGTAATMPTGCTNPLPGSRIATLRRELAVMEADEDRLQHLQSVTATCMNAAQARLLAATMSSEAARFSFLRSLWNGNQISDPAAFSRLSTLFQSASWRMSFQQLVQPR
jgi:hypothetical protein